VAMANQITVGIVGKYPTMLAVFDKNWLRYTVNHFKQKLLRQFFRLLDILREGEGFLGIV